MIASPILSRPVISIEHHANGLPFLKVQISECAQCYGTGSEEIGAFRELPCELCCGKGSQFVLVGKAAEDYADRAISKHQFTEDEEAAVNAALNTISWAEYAARPFVCACGFRQQMSGPCINCGLPVVASEVAA